MEVLEKEEWKCVGDFDVMLQQLTGGTTFAKKRSTRKGSSALWPEIRWRKCKGGSCRDHERISSGDFFLQDTFSPPQKVFRLWGWIHQFEGVCRLHGENSKWWTPQHWWKGRYSICRRNCARTGLRCCAWLVPFDEHGVQQLKGFDGKKLKSIAKDGFNLVMRMRKRRLKKWRWNSELLSKFMKGVHGVEVEEVLVSSCMIVIPGVVHILRVQALQEQIHDALHVLQKRHWNLPQAFHH